MTLKVYEVKVTYADGRISIFKIHALSKSRAIRQLWDELTELHTQIDSISAARVMPFATRSFQTLGGAYHDCY